MNIGSATKCCSFVNKIVKLLYKNCRIFIICRETHFLQFLLVGFDILFTNLEQKKVNIGSKSCTPLGDRTFKSAVP